VLILLEEALAFWSFRWFGAATARDAKRATRLPTWARASIMAAIALPSAAAGLLVLWTRFSAREGIFRILQDDLGRAIFSAGTVFLMLFMLAALAWRAWQLGRGKVNGRGLTTCRDGGSAWGRGSPMD
jgi:hypothetical protein